MSNYWLKLGCFLTGYNYGLIKHSSFASQKTVGKYTSAILLVCLIWGFIGYSFTHQYITHKSSCLDLGAIIAALTMIFIVIQIERQIVLSFNKSGWSASFRIIIGIIMAILGSIIMDQSLFKEDIRLADLDFINRDIDTLLPKKVKLFNEEMDSTEKDYTVLLASKTSIENDVRKNPVILQPTTTTVKDYEQIKGRDRNGLDSVIILPKSRTTAIVNSIPNPNYALLININELIRLNEVKRKNLYNAKQNARNDLEVFLKNNRGFLNELNALGVVLFKKSFPWAFLVWLLFFILFLSIELFVLVNKYSDRDSDYEVSILHQMEFRIEQLNAIKNHN